MSMPSGFCLAHNGTLSLFLTHTHKHTHKCPIHAACVPFTHTHALRHHTCSDAHENMRDYATQTQSRISCLRLEAQQGSACVCVCVCVRASVRLEAERGCLRLQAISGLQTISPSSLVHGCAGCPFTHPHPQMEMCKLSVANIDTVKHRNMETTHTVKLKRQGHSKAECSTKMHTENRHTHTHTCVDVKGRITHTKAALPHVDVTQWPCCHTQCPSATERHRGRGQG